MTLRKKIQNVRKEAKLATDKKKTGAGGSWEFISLSGLYDSLEWLLEKYNLDIEILDTIERGEEVLSVSIVDLDSDEVKTALYRIRNVEKNTGLQYAQDREAQKTFFIRTAIISLFRLKVETSNDSDVNSIVDGKLSNKYNALLTEIKDRATPTYIANIEAQMKLKLEELTIENLERIVKQLDKIEKNKNKKGE